jgi:hypothetical protein
MLISIFQRILVSEDILKIYDLLQCWVHYRDMLLCITINLGEEDVNIIRSFPTRSMIPALVCWPFFLLHLLLCSVSAKDPCNFLVILSAGHRVPYGFQSSLPQISSPR